MSLSHRFLPLLALALLSLLVTTAVVPPPMARAQAPSVGAPCCGYCGRPLGQCRPGCPQYGGSTPSSDDWRDQAMRELQAEARRQARAERRRRLDAERRARDARRRAEAIRLNDQANRAYESRSWTQAVKLYRQALKELPKDETIRQNLERAEKELAWNENFRRERSAHRRKMAKLVATMPVLPPLSPTESQIPEDAAATVARLYEKLQQEGKLSDADAKVFYAALRKRNALLAEAVTKPLPAKERALMDLDLPQSPEPALFRDAAPPPPPSSSPPPGRTAEPQSFALDLMTSTTAKGLEETLESRAAKLLAQGKGKGAARDFGDMLALGKIATSKSPEDAGAEVIDLSISRLRHPDLAARAQFAVDGGRIVSKVAYRALDDFMRKAMAVTGRPFDSEAFWKQFHEDMTVSGKVVKEWTQHGK